MTQGTSLQVIDAAREKFELACKDAASLQIANNFGAAFAAVNIIALLREALSDEVMNKVFMPLMNTKVGFLTDRNGRPNKKGYTAPLYSVSVVRDAIIDAVSIGLLPTGNQFNIIAERMYPTKEGYTALLRKLGVKYFIDVSFDRSQTQGFAEMPCKINYEHNGEKNSFTVVATIRKDDYSSPDQLRGKAERRAKKALYEYITGCDYGDADESSSKVYVDAVVISDEVDKEVAAKGNAGGTISFDAPQEAPAQQQQAAPQPQPQPQPQAAPQQQAAPAQQATKARRTPGF